MTEREIFLGALDRKGARERAAYLDAACAGRPALRQRVEALLRSHREAGDFLGVPALTQMLGAEQSLTFLGPPGSPDGIGRLDHYEVLEVVGRGGAGVVLKARDTKLQRVVALKVLAPRLADCAAARERFVHEAQAAAAVRDEHVVAIHAVHEDGPAPYLVMEYIAGVTLERRIKQAGALRLAEALRIGAQVARGLAAAHGQGLVHRDVKPANVLLENGVERVKLTDFGLARAASAGQLNGGIAGTPAYMAPEQASGEAVDQRSDLFSLGSVLYAMCTGRPPFQGDTTAEVLKAVGEDAPRPVREARPDVPEWLGAVIARLHARRPADRFATAQEVADLLSARLTALQAPHAPTPASAADVVAVAPAPLPRPRRLLVAGCLAALVLVLAVLVAILRPWQSHGQDSPPSDDGRHEAASLELRREDIPPALLALAGGGDPTQAPPELAAVLGDGRFLLPRAGQTSWMSQSPDGQVLAVPLDGDVALFEVPTGKYLRSLKGPGPRALWLAFSRDSRLLAATAWEEGAAGAVRVWDLAADQELFTNPQPGAKVGGPPAFSPDGKHLLTYSDERLHVWGARSGQETQTVELRPGGVPALCFRPDGRRLAVAVWDGQSVKVFDWDGQKLGAARALENPRPVTAVAYSPDGKFLARGDRSGLKLYDAETLEEVRSVPTPAAQLAFTPDSRALFAAWTNEKPKSTHTVTRWDVTTGEELPALMLAASAEPERAFPCLSRDGKALFVTPQVAATYVREIGTDTGKELFPHRGHVAPLHAVAVSPDGRIVASAGEDWAVKLWDLSTGRVLHSMTAQTGVVSGLAFSPDARLVASGSRDGTIALWDVGSGAEVRALHGHSRLPSRLRFSPDGRTLAAGGEGGVVKVWEVATGKEGRPLSGHAGAVRCVAFSPDGKTLASGGDDRSVRLHDLAAGASRVLAATGPVNDVTFSPDGSTLAAVEGDPGCAVRLWDVATGKETAWKGHTGDALGLAFSPAAPLLATCGADGTVRLWDVTAGAPLVRTFGPGPFGGPVRAVAFTPDGRHLATANANGTVYLLRVGAPP